jgi:hypothetical protein
MKILSMKRPRPSTEIVMPAASSLPVNATLVNLDSWSALKLFGLPCRSSASSSAATQNQPSIVTLHTLTLGPNSGVHFKQAASTTSEEARRCDFKETARA